MSHDPADELDFDPIYTGGQEIRGADVDAPVPHCTDCNGPGGRCRRCERPVTAYPTADGAVLACASCGHQPEKEITR